MTAKKSQRSGDTDELNLLGSLRFGERHGGSCHGAGHLRRQLEEIRYALVQASWVEHRIEMLTEKMVLPTVIPGNQPGCSYQGHSGHEPAHLAHRRRLRQRFFREESGSMPSTESKRPGSSRSNEREDRRDHKKCGFEPVYFVIPQGSRGVLRVPCRKREAVLLSPCERWDMFPSYEVLGKSSKSL